MHPVGKILLALGVLGLIATALLGFFGAGAAQSSFEDPFWAGSAATTPATLPISARGDFPYLVCIPKDGTPPDVLTVTDQDGVNIYTPVGQSGSSTGDEDVRQIGHFEVPIGDQNTYTITIQGGGEVEIYSVGDVAAGLFGGLAAMGGSVCLGSCSGFLLLLGLILGLAMKKKADVPPPAADGYGPPRNV